MRNSTARERIPATCRHVRYEGGFAKSCTKPFGHPERKHSFEEEDEEGDMPQAAKPCNGSDICPADFHHPACRAYWREQVQEGPYHSHLSRDGILTTNHPDGHVTSVNVHTEGYGVEQLVKMTKPEFIAHTTERAKGGVVKERDVVAHYTVGEIETIDFIFDKLGYEGGLAAVLANIIKYGSRANHKGQRRSDIEKIRNYATIALEHMDRHGETK